MMIILRQRQGESTGCRVSATGKMSFKHEAHIADEEEKTDRIATRTLIGAYSHFFMRVLASISLSKLTR